MKPRKESGQVAGQFFMLFVFLQIFSTINFDLIMQYVQKQTKSLMIITIAFSLICIVGIMAVSKKFNIWDGKIRITKKQALIIIFGFLAVKVVAFAGGFLMYNVLGQNAPEDSTQLLEGFQDLPKFLYATCYGVASPIMEENFYRGGFINILFEDKKIIGLILGSFLFSFFHGITNPTLFLFNMFIGLIIGLSYILSEQIEVPIVIHVLHNLSSIIFIF